MSAQGLSQVQRQTQSLVLAPQLRQSLKILQVPAMELRNTILEELEHNPALEELPMDGVSIEEQAAGTEPADGPADEPPDKELEFDDSYELLDRLDAASRDYYAEENGGVYTADDAARRQHFFDSLTAETSLQEHLMRQAEMTELDAEVRRALEYLVGSLDDRGFLSGSLADIALMAELPLRAMQEAHALLVTLDPPGIGSLSLQGCLLTQLEGEGKGAGLAATIVAEHFELLLRRRVPDIARKIGLSVDQVQDALEEIAALDPAPGRRFSEDSNRVVEPDVRVEWDNGEWVVILNNDYIPRLRLSSTYKNLIARGALRGKEREYLQGKIRSGKFLMSSIEQRQQTIERITREILKFQRDFFEEGVSKLRPLTMSQVADEVGVHETTVSRAIANKYIETPHGVFEFRFFFTSGYQSGGGEAVANTSIKERIARIIEGEDPTKPLSDQKVVDLLAGEEIKIARRTVAKYREEMGILPTNLRRRYH